MKQKLCELCRSPAKMYCESDRANLCWDCDRKVHGANFLVTRHSRTLLCHACQRPTSWRASGLKLTPSISICGVCAEGRRAAESNGELCGGNSGGSHGYDSIDDDDYDEEEGEGEEEDEDDEEEEEENQVVPWESSSPAMDPISGSSSSDEESSNPATRRRESTSVSSRKRRRPQ